MIVGQLKKIPFDKMIVLPAVVFVVQSIPWLNARFRLRALVPLMLLYVFITLVKSERRFMFAKERFAANCALIGYTMYSISCIILWWRFYGRYPNNLVASRIFGLFGLWVFIDLVAENKIREIKTLVLVLLGSLFVASLMGGMYLGVEMNQNIMREMVGGAASNVDSMDASLSGVGGYGTVYSVGLLSPCILYAATQVKQRILKLFFVVASFVFFVYAFRAGFSILMIAMFMGFLFYAGVFLIPNYGLNITFMLISVILLLFFTMYPQIARAFTSPLVMLAEALENPNYTARLESIIDNISGSGGVGSSYAMDRTGLMWLSWRAFLQSPYVGVLDSPAAIGGHSFVFDYLAKGGVLYFIFLPISIFCHIFYLKTTVYNLCKKSRLLIGTYFMTVLIVCLLNPLESAIIYYSFFLILPGITLFYKDSVLNKSKYR